ncbi:MAG: ATP-binding protein [Candidatus Lokiarchaeia archaeon]
MCQYCVTHGMGTKWYLNPKNLNLKKAWEDADIRSISEALATGGPKSLVETIAAVNALVDELPLSKETIEAFNNMSEQNNGGQIIPLEDAIKVLKIPQRFDVKIGLTYCACRKQWGGQDKLICMHLEPFCDVLKKSQGTLSKYDRYITPDEAIEICRESSKEGLVQWVQWGPMPHVIGVCNCELPYCIVFRTRMLSSVRNAAIKSHYVAQIDPSKCDGCGGSPQCLLACNFGAIKFSRLEQFSVVNPIICFGCGVCRDKCENKAIRLVDRESVAVAKDLW